jgi:hypothetical protein
LASVNEFIVLQVALQLLDNFDSHLEVVSSVSVDQFADVLALVGALTDDGAVALKEVLDEELVEFVGWTMSLFRVDLERESLAEDKSIRESALNR